MDKPKYVVMEHHSVRTLPASWVRDEPEMYYGLERKEMAWNFHGPWDQYRRVHTGTLREVVDWARATHGEEVAQAILDAAVECRRNHPLPCASSPAVNHPSCGRVSS